MCRSPGPGPQVLFRGRGLAGEGLTGGGHHRHGPHALPAMEAIEVHFILPVRFQARDGDLILVPCNGHRLGLPLCILVLDQEGVEGALGHRPGQAQGVWSRASHSHFPQQRLRGALWAAGLLSLLWGCK